MLSLVIALLGLWRRFFSWVKMSGFSLCSKEQAQSCHRGVEEADCDVEGEDSLGGSSAEGSASCNYSLWHTY